ncbi:MAG: ornithine cyclodeaminase family protein, partial [bacterium]
MLQQLYSRERIARETELESVVSKVKEAFVAKHQDKVQMPSKIYLTFDEFNGDLRTMPAYIPSFDLATVKIVNAHPENPSRHNLPTVMALVAAINPETGQPLAVLDGSEITALRTAAASALSTRCFAPDGSTVLGLFGTGAQAPYQIEGQLNEINFDRIILHDIDTDSARELKEWVEARHPDISVVIAEEPEELIEQCDVINSLTPSKSPLIESFTELSKPVLLNALGADSHDKQEWPDRILNHFKIVVDDWEQASHSGEISQRVAAGNFT